MIELFHIPKYNIDTSKFSHYLHGSIVNEFEQNFASYVGAKYACSVNSATHAIFLTVVDQFTTVEIPSMIPPVVVNAILTSGNHVKFIDNIHWVGDSYILHKFHDYKIIDSAQKVERNEFMDVNDNDLMIFSFYPTKPVGSMDGGMIVSNDKDKIDYLRTLSFNGMSFSTNNWERKVKMPGYKMYMNSIQAHIANENLKLLDQKKSVLKDIRDYYNRNLGYNNTSEHLYRINVEERDTFIKYMRDHGITCGIHYESQHDNPVYKNLNSVFGSHFPKSEKESKTTVSIPFHEKLEQSDLDYIIERIDANRNKLLPAT